jgi:exo-1,4-beta-D-glucosaminidase
VRAEIVNNADGDEILPVTWNDNYVTVFGGESMTLEARYRAADAGGSGLRVRIQGHNVPMMTGNLASSVSATTSGH